MTPEEQQLLQSIIEQALTAHEASRSIDWGKVLDTAIGTGLGAAIALIGLFLQSRLTFWDKLKEDKRSTDFSTQQWFENRYIDEGVVALYQQVVRLSLLTSKAANRSDILVAVRNWDDTIALSRCQEILGESVIACWFIMVRSCCQLVNHTETSEQLHRVINLLCDELPKLRDALRGCCVRSKTDIRDITKQPAVKKVCDDFNNEASQILDAHKKHNGQ